MSSLEKMYEEHHATQREQGFSILKEDRGTLFASLVGTGKKVLDLGCRDGALTAYFTSGNTVTGVDIDSRSLERAAQQLGIETIQLDIYSDWEALQGRQYEVAVAGEVLEHLFHPAKIIKKVADHLVPEGTFIGSVPNAFSIKNRIRLASGSKKGTPLSDPTHINHFSLKELQQTLGTYFEDVEIKGLGRYANLARLFPSACAFDLVFVAKRPKTLD